MSKEFRQITVAELHQLLADQIEAGRGDLPVELEGNEFDDRCIGLTPYGSVVELRSLWFGEVDGGGPESVITPQGDNDDA